MNVETSLGTCAERFELNPVTWFVLANHGVTVRGRTVDMLGIYVDTGARTRFVIDNLRGYWQLLAAEPREAASGRSDDGFGVGIVEWAPSGPSGSTSPPGKVE